MTALTDATARNRCVACAGRRPNPRHSTHEEGESYSQIVAEQFSGRAQSPDSTYLRMTASLHGARAENCLNPDDSTSQAGYMLKDKTMLLNGLILQEK
jgi:hypothetical protein